MHKSPQNKPILILTIAAFTVLAAAGCTAPKNEAKKTAVEIMTLPSVQVKKMTLNEKVDLPGQLLAYQNVPIHAKVEGYISWIGVDRGSKVKTGEKMISIYCPELEEKVKEAQAKLSSAKANLAQSRSALQAEISKELETKAKLESDQLTYNRLVIAAKTPGAIAANEVDVAEKTVESDRAQVESAHSSVAAAKSLVESEKSNVIAAENVLKSVQDMRTYLTIKAPFNGVITERNVHVGSIVSVSATRSQGDMPLVRIQQKSLLRLVVAVPESMVSGLDVGTKMPFTVPAFIGRTFWGTVARPGYALDETTRTMPIELDVPNADGQLEPGMFATVHWTATRPYATLFVPSSSVVTNLEGSFVVKIENGMARLVRIKRGQSMENWVEIVGDLSAGDRVALVGTDEIKDKTPVQSVEATTKDMEAAFKHSGSGGE